MPVSYTHLEKYHVQFLYDVAGYLETLDKICTLEGRLFIPAHADAVVDIHPLAEVNRAKVQDCLLYTSRAWTTFSSTRNTAPWG